ncbi:Ku protein [Sphingoaurantiacus capsulatus]|uniref:Non-homologous end joining protein Ku n=1 Tax=Sphingoaurantiacus capsulatus TaxID=1771310 RepID=A0ABV7XCS5_9SPHN
MAARAYWSGQIRLALVSIPVELYSATRSAGGISFNQIHEPSGKRIKYEKTVPGLGAVDPADIAKGYEYEKGNYVLLDEKEIEGVKLESKKTLELTQFVDFDEIDAIYFDKPYFVVPQDDLAEEAFRVVRDALKKTKKVGLGQLALRGREYICALKPCGQGMVLETLRYAEEVNKAKQFFRGIGNEESPAELMELATTLIEKKTKKFDPDAFHDRYEDALRALIDRKLSGKRTIKAANDEAEVKPSNVVDLMAALKASLEKSPAKGKAKPAAKPAAKKAPAKAPARKRA